jgi:hypothetical protein
VIRSSNHALRLYEKNRLKRGTCAAASNMQNIISLSLRFPRKFFFNNLKNTEEEEEEEEEEEDTSFEVC